MESGVLNHITLNMRQNYISINLIQIGSFLYINYIFLFCTNY